MQPSFTELALCTPCSRLWQRKCARALWRVLREGASVALCAVAARSVPTHFITSLFLSFSLPLSLRSILECHRQASRHFCIYFLLLFIHGLAQQQQSWGKSISHTTSAPLKCLIILFHGSLWDGGWGDFGTFTKLSSVENRKMGTSERTPLKHLTSKGENMSGDFTPFLKIKNFTPISFRTWAVLNL